MTSCFINSSVKTALVNTANGYSHVKKVVVRTISMCGLSYFCFYRLCSHMFPAGGGHVFCSVTVMCEGMQNKVQMLNVILTSKLGHGWTSKL